MFAWHLCFMTMRFYHSVLEFEIYLLVMYDDYIWHGYLEIYLYADEALWYYSAAMFWKFKYACFELIEEVASKFFIWSYHSRVLSLLEFKVLHLPTHWGYFYGYPSGMRPIAIPTFCDACNSPFICARMWLFVSVRILFGISEFWLKKGILVILDSRVF